MGEYKICKRCIMDTTSDPNLILDENGICNYCHAYDEAVKRMKFQKKSDTESLESIFDRIKKDSKDREYDCLLGISGGVDSSYMAYLANKYNLRVLAVHVDAGWNTELAVQNIQNMCSNLGFDLHTVVIDWLTMKELQRAYMFSGMANLDVPQDHCFMAATNQMVKKFHVKYILQGFNYATEGILSKAFQYDAADWINIKGIYKKCGRGLVSLKKYPHENFFRRYIAIEELKSVVTIHPLNYINYSKKMAIDTLEKEFGWRYYGGKHYESRFTKFFQETYLPQRYGWDKRRDHIASLIVGGEMSREEGLREMKIPPSTKDEMDEERNYVLRKLEINDEEWKEILSMPYRTEDDYPNSKKLIQAGKKVKHAFVKQKL